jgi:hypothetical protein
MKATIEAMSSKEMGNYKVSRVFIICLPPHSGHKMQPLDKAHMVPQKHSVAKKFKNGSIQTQGDSSLSTKWANCLENASKLQQAQQWLIAAGRQAFSPVT